MAGVIHEWVTTVPTGMMTAIGYGITAGTVGKRLTRLKAWNPPVGEMAEQIMPPLAAKGLCPRSVSMCQVSLWISSVESF